MCGITTLLKRALSSKPLNESRTPEATKRIIAPSKLNWPSAGPQRSMVLALSAYNSVGLVRNN
jgi:hypothetical protein